MMEKRISYPKRNCRFETSMELAFVTLTEGSSVVGVLDACSTAGFSDPVNGTKPTYMLSRSKIE